MKFTKRPSLTLKSDPGAPLSAALEFETDTAGLARIEIVLDDRRPPAEREAGGRSSADQPVSEDLKLEDFVTYRLNHLTRILNRWSNRMFAEEFAITLAEWRVLSQLAVKAPATIRDLTNRMYLDQALISRVTASLVERGLVERRADPADGRSTLLSLSASGRELHDSAMPVGQARQRALLECLEPEERSALYRALDKLADHVGNGIGGNGRAAG